MDFEEDDAFEGIPQNVHYWEEARLHQSSFQLLVHTHQHYSFIHSCTKRNSSTTLKALQIKLFRYL